MCRYTVYMYANCWHGLRRPFCSERCDQEKRCTIDPGSNLEGVIVPRGKVRCSGWREKDDPRLYPDWLWKIRRIKFEEDLDDEKPVWYVEEMEMTFHEWADVQWELSTDKPRDPDSPPMSPRTKTSGIADLSKLSLGPHSRRESRKSLGHWHFGRR